MGQAAHVRTVTLWSPFARDSVDADANSWRRLVGGVNAAWWVGEMLMW